MKKHLKLIIASIVLVALLVPTIVIIAVAGRGDDEQTFALQSGLPTQILFDPHTDSLPLPAIISNGPVSYTWSIYTGAQHVELDEHESRFRPLPLPDGTSATNVVFRVRVVGTNREVSLNHAIVLNDPIVPNLTRLFSSNQSNRSTHRVQGIAMHRAFGLWDVICEENDTTNNIFTPETATDSSCGQYRMSGDVMHLAWRYGGTIEMNIEVLDGNGNVLGTADETTPFVDGVVNVSATENANDIINRLDIEFLGEGVRTIRATATSVANPAQYAVYTYTYDIRDAINAFVFDEVKRIERNARFDYILNGVIGECGTVWTTGANLGGLTPMEYLHANWYNPNRTNFATNIRHLHSTRFATNTRTHSSILSSQIFAEFERWSPSFTYRDLVIRNNMQTWEEGTWFFGNVFGNGHQLDATPYAAQTQTTAGVFRNTHGSGMVGQGFERETANRRRGSGWGEKYAFYILANNSVLDNITLTGNNITRADGRNPLVSDFHTLSVLGTSNLSGGRYDFQMENRNTDGDFTGHDFHANITIQNSIIEKGLVLVGAAYFPDRTQPLIIDTTVLRYSAFTGVFLRAPSDYDITPGQHRFNGSAVRTNNILGEMPVSYDILEELNSPVRPGQARRFGNFVETRNLTVYDIATATFIADENESGSHLTITGNHNNFFTWIRVVDLILPPFRMPGTAWNAPLAIDASTLAQREIDAVIRNQRFADGHIPDGPTTWLNLLFLGIESDLTNGGDLIKSSHMSIENSNLIKDDHMFNIDPFVGFTEINAGLQINAYIIRVSATTGISPSRDEQRARFAGANGGISGLIRSKCIVNGVRV